MIGLILLVGFIKVSIHYNNPLILAGLYTALAAFSSALYGMELDILLVSTVITFWLMWLFFWLLDRYEDSGVWWAIVIVFPPLMFGLNAAL